MAEKASGLCGTLERAWNRLRRSVGRERIAWFGGREVWARRDAVRGLDDQGLRTEGNRKNEMGVKGGAGLDYMDPAPRKRPLPPSRLGTWGSMAASPRRSRRRSCRGFHRWNDCGQVLQMARRRAFPVSLCKWHPQRMRMARMMRKVSVYSPYVSVTQCASVCMRGGGGHVFGDGI